MTKYAKTNANSFSPDFRGIRRAEWPVQLKGYVRRAARHILKREVDDFDWQTYHQYYGPQNEVEARNFTYDLGEVEYVLVDGRLYTIADAKPMNPWHRVLFEAISNLPHFTSLHEVGTGGGKLIINLGNILGKGVTLGASDIGRGQLELFRQRWPSEFGLIQPFVHDLTENPLPESARADVVFAATVLMHVKRDLPYRAALANLLASSIKYSVVIDNWAAHEYHDDFARMIATSRLGSLHVYDSGAAVALIVSLDAAAHLPPCFEPLTKATQLRKYG